MPYQNLNCNLTEYWRNHKSVTYPLNEVALKYNLIPATSITSKKIFSKTGQIIA